MIFQTSWKKILSVINPIRLPKLRAPAFIFQTRQVYWSYGFYANTITQQRQNSVLTWGVKRPALSVRGYAVHLLQHDRKHGIKQQRTPGDHYTIHHSGLEHSIRVFKSHQTTWRPGIDGIAGSWKGVRQMYLIYLDDGSLRISCQTMYINVYIVISD